VIAALAPQGMSGETKAARDCVYHLSGRPHRVESTLTRLTALSDAAERRLAAGCLPVGFSRQPK
jgi:hypothetical protein